MHKLGIANPYWDKTGTKGAGACTIALAALWLFLFKRLLYPVLYNYLRTQSDHALVAQGIHSAVLVATLAILLLAYSRLGSSLLSRRATAACGLLGAIGLALLAFSDFSTGSQVIGGYAGSALVAAACPTLFLFWGLYAWQLGQKSFMHVVAGSIALFVLSAIALTAAGLNNVYASIACPLISGFAALAAPRASQLEPAKDLQANLRAQPGKAPAAQAQPDAAQPDAQPDAQLDSGALLSAMPTGAIRSGEAQDAPVLHPHLTSQPEAPSDASALHAFSAAYGLSDRETELAAYAYRNYSARRIASELFIAESTVYTHLKRIYRKTDVHSRQELIDLIDRWMRGEHNSRQAKPKVNSPGGLADD